MKVMTPQRGEVVISLQGRDKGCYYVITEVVKDGALVVNGVTRKLVNPKKKNVKHLKLLPESVFDAGINYPWDKAFDDRVAYYLKNIGSEER